MITPDKQSIIKKFEESETLFQNQNWIEALSGFQWLEENTPGTVINHNEQDINIIARFKIAKCYMELNEYDKALKQLNKLNKILKDDEDILFDILYVLEKSGDINAASDVIEHILELKTEEDPDLMLRQAQLSIKLNEWQKALDILEYLSQFYHDYLGEPLYIFLLECYRQAGNKYDELKTIETLQKLNPLKIEYIEQRYNWHYDNYEFEKILELTDEIFTQDEFIPSPELILIISKSYIALEKISELILFLQELYNKFSSEITLLIAIADSYKQLELYEIALKMFTYAKLLEPDEQLNQTITDEIEKLEIEINKDENDKISRILYMLSIDENF